MTVPSETPTAAVRRFNRFYTRRIGVLQEGLAETRFSLAESRLLWEFAHRDRTTAAELARDLGLDPGYLSRLLRGLKEDKLIRSVRSEDDARHLHLSLSAAGKRAFAPLDKHSEDGVAALLAPLGEAEQAKLLAAMRTIEQLLDSERSAAATPWLLRPPQSGDIGWVVGRHGALYAREYGWDWRFEALVARIAADFVDRFDPAREACWIAERTAATSAASSSSRRATRARRRRRWKARRSCACCSSSRRRAASASAPAWSTNASASPAPAAIAGSSSGPTASSSAARAIYRRAGYVLTSERAARELRPLAGRRDLGARARPGRYGQLAEAHRVDRRQVAADLCQLSPASSLDQQLPVVLAISSLFPPASTARPWR